MGRQHTSAPQHISSGVSFWRHKRNNKTMSRGEWRKTATLQGLAWVENSYFLRFDKKWHPYHFTSSLPQLLCPLLQTSQLKEGNSPFPSTPSRGWSPRASIHTYTPPTHHGSQAGFTLAVFLRYIILKIASACCHLGMALASKWRGSKMLKSRVCQGAFHHNTARHGLLNRLVLDPLQLCTMLSYLYQDPIILQSNEIEWLDCITSPDSLGWAHKQTSALLLFEDEASHCKDLS